MKRLAIVTTHPIQYNAPLFKLLAERKNIDIKVFYTWGESVLEKKYDPGFGKVIEWDIPLLEGYEYEFIENMATDKGSHHYNGIINPGLIKAIKAWAPDFVLFYGWSFKSHFKAMRYFKNKIPVLFRGDSTLLDKKAGIKSVIRRIFLWRVYRNIDKAIYTGKNNFDYFKYAGLKDKQLVYAPHVVNNKMFTCIEAACTEQAALFRKQFDIKPQEIIFLFAGKLESKKDPAILLAAFTDAQLQNTQLVVVGNGALENELKKKYGTQENIHFLDFQNQSVMPAVYEMADVFVLPSKGPGETWGLAINEAMANGKAIIASDKCGGAVDLVKENGLIFKSGCKDDLIEAIKSIATDRDKLNSMKNESRNIISKMTLEEVARIIESIV